MDITGSYTFTAPPERVWDLMMDPKAIASCIPGCEALEPDGVDRYRARDHARHSPPSPAPTTAPSSSPRKWQKSSYRLAVEGQGRPGFVKGNAAITLRPEGGGTVVDLTATVQTGGAIARLGQRLIGSAAKMMQDRFFACMQSKV